MNTIIHNLIIVFDKLKYVYLVEFNIIVLDNFTVNITLAGESAISDLGGLL